MAHDTEQAPEHDRVGPPVENITVFDLPGHFSVPITASLHPMSGTADHRAAGLDFRKSFIGYDLQQDGNACTYFIGDPDSVRFPHFNYATFPDSISSRDRSRDGSRDAILVGWFEQITENAPPFALPGSDDFLCDLGTPRLLSVAFRHLMGQLKAGGDNCRSIVLLPDHAVSTHQPPSRLAALFGTNDQSPTHQQTPYLIDVPWFTDALLADPHLLASFHVPHPVDLSPFGTPVIRPTDLPGLVPITPDTLYVSRCAALLADLFLCLTDNPARPVEWVSPTNPVHHATGRGGVSVGALSSALGAPTKQPLEFFFLALEAQTLERGSDWMVTPSVLCLDPLGIAPLTVTPITSAVVDPFTLGHPGDLSSYLRSLFGAIQEASPDLFRHLTKTIGFDHDAPVVLPLDPVTGWISPAQMADRIPGASAPLPQFSWPLGGALAHRGAFKLAVMQAGHSGIKISLPARLSSLESDSRWQLGGEAVTPPKRSPDAMIGAAQDNSGTVINPSPQPSVAVGKVATDSESRQKPAEVATLQDGVSMPQAGKIASDQVEHGADDTQEGTESTSPARAIEAEDCEDTSRDDTDQDEDSAKKSIAIDPEDAQLAQSLSAPASWISGIRDWLARLSTDPRFSPHSTMLARGTEPLLLGHLVRRLRLAGIGADASGSDLEAALESPQTLGKIAASIAVGGYDPALYFPDAAVEKAADQTNSPVPPGPVSPTTNSPVATEEQPSAVPQPAKDPAPVPDLASRNGQQPGGPKGAVRDPVSGALLQKVADQRPGIQRVGSFVASTTPAAVPATDRATGTLKARFMVNTGSLGYMAPAVAALPSDIRSDWLNRLNASLSSYLESGKADPDHERANHLFVGMHGTALLVAMNNLSGSKRKRFTDAEIAANTAALPRTDWAQIMSAILRAASIPPDALREPPGDDNSDEMLIRWREAVLGELSDSATSRERDDRCSAVLSLLMVALRQRAGNEAGPISLPRTIPFDDLPDDWRSASLEELHRRLRCEAGAEDDGGESGTARSKDGGADGQVKDTSSASTDGTTEKPDATDTEDAPMFSVPAAPRHTFNAADDQQAEQFWQTRSPPLWERYGVNAASVSRNGTYDIEFKKTLSAAFGGFGVTFIQAAKIGATTVAYWKQRIEALPDDDEPLDASDFEWALRHALSHVLARGEIAVRRLDPITQPQTDII